MKRSGHKTAAIVLIALGLAINAAVVIVAFTVPIEPLAPSGLPTATGVALLGVDGVGVLMIGLGVLLLVLRHVRR